jgi:hypothetical protein
VQEDRLLSVQSRVLPKPGCHIGVQPDCTEFYESLTPIMAAGGSPTSTPSCSGDRAGGPLRVVDARLM